MSTVPLMAQGWTLLFHQCIVQQLTTLHKAVLRAQKANPATAEHNANVKLFRAVSTLIIATIPANPGHTRFRQGTTLGQGHAHWRRAKIGCRFRLFFRYDSASKTIIYAWLNDTNSLRSAGSDSDPYTLFRKMLERGHPPYSWEELYGAAQSATYMEIEE